jgi:hypothetical protein
MSKSIFCAVLLIALCCLAAARAGAQESHQFVVVPRDQGLILIASQPECPLKFENARLLVNMEGFWEKSFELRNLGTKPIRSYAVAAIGTDKWGWTAPDAAHYIQPGQIAPPIAPDSRDEIIPLTRELSEKLNLKGQMKDIVGLIVVRVEFADGSTFEEKGYEEQKEYFEKLH